MKNLKIFTLSLIFLIANYFAALADLTASAPSNMISSIASSSSFTSLDQNSAQAQNVTDNLLDSEQLQEAVEDGAETFGTQQNDTTLEAAEEEQQLVALNSTKVPGLEYPEPNLDTMIYDTGLMTLTENTSAQYNGGAGDDTNIFSGEQKARIKVYIDFVRQKQWGFVESHITLTVAKDTDNNEKTMINVFDGGATTVTKLPVDSELIHTISSDTGRPLNIDNNVEPAFGNEESPFSFDPHSITSLLQDKTTPTLALYEKGGFPDLDLADMQKSVSHGTGGDKNVLVTAKFSTGSGGTLGTSTAAFEISKVGICASGDACTTTEIEAIKTSIVRLDATATTTATKYTGE
jgi:hypothetical protein